MKRFPLTALCVVALGLMASVAAAQRDDEPRRGGRGPRDRGPEARPPHPVLALFDTDRDGEISAKEIENAAAALKALDRNKDGKLTIRELPRPPFGGPGGPGAGGPAGRGGFGRGGFGDPAQFVQQMMEYDKNKDGKITRDELPEQRQRVLQFADRNDDGALDKQEIEQLAARFRAGRGRGGPGRDGQRPDRPQRPQRPQADPDNGS